MNYINILSIGEEIEKANRWLQSFTENKLSSPLVGYIIFAVLIILAWAFIKGFADK